MAKPGYVRGLQQEFSGNPDILAEHVVRSSYIIEIRDHNPNCPISQAIQKYQEGEGE